MSQIHVLFVCLGNICRSPSAHGVFQKMVIDRGLADRIEVDSAGTSDWHIGKKPDPRSIEHAAKRGYDLTPLRARQAIRSDFEHYDYILAMDLANLSDLKALAPADYQGFLGLLLSFAETPEQEVPDPYHGGEAGFEHVLDLIENACERLLDQILAASK